MELRNPIEILVLKPIAASPVMGNPENKPNRATIINGKWIIVFEFSPGKPDTGVGIHAVRERGRLVVVNLFYQFAHCRGFPKEGERVNDPVRLLLDQLGGNTASECGYLVGHRAVDERGDHVVRRDALDIARTVSLRYQLSSVVFSS